MTIHALGVDVSTRRTALVLVDADGYVDHRVASHVTKDGGPRRLHHVALTVHGTLATAGWRPTIGAVEAPLNRFRSWPLESCAAVVMQVVQARYPDAAIDDPRPSEWQSETVGPTPKHDDPKMRSLAHARANGLPTVDDDDLADAYCIAEYALGLYTRSIGRAA